MTEIEKAVQAAWSMAQSIVSSWNIQDLGENDEAGVSFKSTIDTLKYNLAHCIPAEGSSLMSGLDVEQQAFLLGVFAMHQQ